VRARERGQADRRRGADKERMKGKFKGREHRVKGRK
jgi:hypothetical protein